jgi:hypothetical protein
MQGVFRQICSVVLGVMFMLYIIPKELYHGLTHHTDTEHTATEHDLQISAEHHHCELLKLDQHFSGYAFTPAGVEQVLQICAYAPYTPWYKADAIVQPFKNSTTLRGPPVCRM